ncbi:acyl-CoA dehydrogenase family protein [Micromonospora sp. NBC_01796]|uniref:acyl-CoA dehydrogenase family protein n=1 Tax=Micromonospora sp. NBC_01796 TaxID=2975987 RepID=UPI002DD8B68F|nr:acyl-CoA dehydrogenase family protein [Micromonospora sp. NBC_01796]WSA84722.1 acyl-CoA/acyl-ACP dehydrogenase [Micromonospora sp. NBC_01796]
MTNLRYDETEEALRESVRALLRAHSPWSAVLARVDGVESYDPGLWRRLGTDLGLAGLAVPEALGGAGAGFREVAVVLEELGRAVAPVPYLGHAVAVRALLTCVETDLLGEVATGERIAVLAVPFATPPGPPEPTVVGGGDLTGTIVGVADALPADLLLVPATDGLYLVEADGPGVSRVPVVSLDATRQLCDIVLDGAPGRRIAAGHAAVGAVTDALTAGAALLAAEQVGVAQWCLDTTVEYVKQRHQFGRPVGSFQAVKHRLADVWVSVTEARAVARYAADCLANDSVDTPVAAALAQAYCGDVAVTAAQECVQLHGGIGFTWEHPAHLYLKRAKSAAIGFGTADRHRAKLAILADLPG